MNTTKYLLIGFLAFFQLLIFGQQKGVTHFQNEKQNGDRGSTYAVVVGISDYQDPAIPDLRFADKDAEAFANYLISDAGGRCDKDHLKLLTNEHATAGRIAEALDGLIEKVHEADQVYIYFSGHGDVERKTISQPGFLLCWDALSSVYMGGGTYSLAYLQEIVTTLSLQNKAKVIVITDACHAGKLAGNQIGGSQLTATNLSKQFANEVKILSCQPNEYSIEGEQWGRGRGAFSYHLINGLYGLADIDEDQTISLFEIGRYLEDKVSREVAPIVQIPMTIGDRAQQLVSVKPEMIVALSSGKEIKQTNLSTIESRGIEEEVLTEVNDTIRKIYLLFKQALKEKVFLEPKENCANAYFAKLLSEPKLKKLIPTMKRNFAAALQDESQQVLIMWLKKDPRELGITKVKQYEKYKLYPKYLEKACELLGDKHYMYRLIKANKLFFEGYLMYIDYRHSDKELGEKVMEKYRSSIQYWPDLPHVYFFMSGVSFFMLQNADSAEYYMQKAVELSPSWEIPYSTMGFNYANATVLRNFKKSLHFLELADQVDTSKAENNIIHMGNWAAYYIESGQYSKAEQKLKEVIRLDSTLFWTYNQLATLFYYSNRFKDAEINYKKSLELESADFITLTGYGTLCIALGKYNYSKTLFQKAHQCDTNSLWPLIGLAEVDIFLGNYAEAELRFSKVMQRDSNAIWAYHNIGDTYLKVKNYYKAKQYFKKVIEMDSSWVEGYYYLANIAFNENKIDEAFNILELAFKFGSNDYNAVQEYLELAPLRQYKVKWDSLMKKYFPEKFIDK